MEFFKILLLLVSLLIDFVRTQDQLPEESLTVKDGQRDVLLVCSFPFNQNTTFDWTLGGQIIGKDDGRRYQDGKDLRFRWISRKLDSAGTYRCMTTNQTSGISHLSSPIRLNVIWLSMTIGGGITLARPFSPHQIQSNQEVILECSVEGSLEIQFKWFKNGHRLLPDGRRWIVLGKRLHLPQPTVEDNGSYDCSASSDAGQVESLQSFHLIIRVPSFPFLVIGPKNEYLHRNSSSVQFDCLFSSSEALVQWSRNGILLEENSRINLAPNGTLHIYKPRQEDIGKYKCLTFHLQEQSYTANYQIPTLESLRLESLIPTPLSSTSQLGFRLGAQVQVHCDPPIGNPPPNLLTWQDPQNKTIQGTETDIHVEENTLHIPHLEETHVGRWTCRTENMAGMTSLVSFLLVITTEPFLIGQPESAVKNEGETISLTCTYTGSPHPLSEVKWWHNGIQVRESILHPHHRHRRRIKNSEFVGKLILSNLRLEDAGSYTCELITQGYPAIQSKPATLLVLEVLQFVSPPVDRRLELGSTTRIPCRATGSLPLSIKWNKVDLINWPKNVDDENGVLNFHPVEKEDAGSYVCVASNSQGTITATIQISVHSSPKFIISPKNPTEGTEGESLRLDCQADGDPSPTIKWDQDADTSVLDSERFEILLNGSLLIRSLTRNDDQRRFGCTAGNSGGFKRAEVNLLVRAVGESLTPVEEFGSAVMTWTVTLTLSVAAGYMILVIGLMAWCRYRQLKRKQSYLIDIQNEVGETELKDGFLPNGTSMKPSSKAGSCIESIKSDGETGKSTHSSSVPTGKHTSTPASIASHQSHQSKRSGHCSNYEDIAGERKDLQFVLLLGHGIFGEVFLAKSKDQLVMVKSLQIKDEEVLMEFKREVDMFYKLSHENISRLVRLCREMDPHYMIMEYSDWGDLKQFLLATRKESPRVPKPAILTSKQIHQILSQIATGMDHLASLRFVHKDLATRNCLLGSGLRVHISNPALSRDTYANEYFLYKNRVVPLRWLSPEALLEGDYSTKSDIWAFGWTIWEIINQAALPFSELRDEEVVMCLESKEIEKYLGVENIVPFELQRLFRSCREFCPRERPTFQSILKSLSQVNSDSN